MAAIEKACALEPMNGSYLKQAGRIFALVGQMDDAIQYYRKALQWGDDDPAVRMALDELTRAAAAAAPARRGLFGRTG